MAIFVKADKKAYTAMSTYHLIDPETAKETKAKSKGLLTQMLSLPEDWNYSEKGLTAINEKDGRTSIRTALKELEENGYLERSQERNKDNKLGKAIYTVYEKPKELMQNVNLEVVTDKSQIFRVVHTAGFSCLSNYHLRDKTLSLSAKCVLSQILVLPETVNITIEFLASINSDSIPSISKYLKELISAGYVICKGRERRKDGTFGDMIYEVYEKPVESAESTIKRDNSPTTKIPTTENPTTENPTTENPTTENPTTENPTTENEPNKLLNNKLLNNKLSINQSINQKKKDKIDGSKETNSNYEDYKEIIKKNIGFEDFCKTRTINEIKIIEEIVDIMAETVAFSKNDIKINKSLVPAELVKKRFLEIQSDNVEYVLETFMANSSKIVNIRAYMIAMLFNSKSTINSYYQNEVQSDYWGEK